MPNVSLVWSTPNARELLVSMARVSNPLSSNDSGKLVRYLINHKHWSPFEMVNFCFEIQTTRDIGRQILRHRSLSFQEFSQRYASPFRDARLQHPTNRQQSIDDVSETTNAWWQSAQAQVANHVETIYNQALMMGVAREVARVVLPEGLTQTRMYANGTLRSWIHFYQVRSIEGGAQREIVDIAESIWHNIVTVLPELATETNQPESKNECN